METQIRIIKSSFKINQIAINSFQLLFQ